MIQTPSTAVNQMLMNELLDRVAVDAGAAVSLPLAVVGHELGLFAALSEVAPVTSVQLAARTGLAERYLREWLLVMASSGYVSCADETAGAEPKRSARYWLSPEQTEAFTNPDSVSYVVSRFRNIAAGLHMASRLVDVFRTGEGIGWHEQHEDIFSTTEEIFRPQYLANLTSSWIPAFTGVEEQLVRGARVADIGCGFGTSTIIMANAYPNSAFTAIDNHAPSIAKARERAASSGAAGRIAFETAAASDLRGTYDFITFFDCLHDMPDPLTALRSARASLAPGGRVMLVEPKSWDTVEETVGNPTARATIGMSLLVCLPSGLSSPPALGLGNQGGPARTARLATDAGFGESRVATSTEAHLVYELAH